jgi:bifunctional DNA-binding transcriptional regulator/antitoxin component of YhaV-PrlF toxin-antitoxin module
MVTTVGTDGQLVIEKEILEELGIEPGWTAIQQIVEGHLVVYFVPPRHNRSLHGVLAPYTDVRVPDEDALHEAMEWSRSAEAEELERMREESCE